jgi:D-lactate dehydrogenase
MEAKGENAMNIAVFSTKPYDKQFLLQANAEHGHHFTFFEPRLTPETVALGRGFEGLCVFVNDQLPRGILQTLASNGTRLIALRCAGFNNVDLEAAADLGLTVVRVPAYSPHAVAEHTLGLILALNRKFHRAYNRVREGNFALDGLLGFDLYGQTVGLIGTGQIGAVMAQVMLGLGCRVLAHDPYPNPKVEALGIPYLPLEELLPQADILSLHCPLTPDTYHLINAQTLTQTKHGVMLINTSRGALLDTRAVIDALKSGQIGYLGLDVYEEEADLFFEDLSETIIQDDLFTRLLTFPNVLITAHQAFFTRNALWQIATVTLNNISAFARGEVLANQVKPEQRRKR